MRIIDRRIRALEAVIMPLQTRDYLPLAPDEILDVIRRIETGGKFTTVELERFEQHSPLMHGEYLLSCHRRNLVVKRYGGVDVVNDL